MQSNPCLTRYIVEASLLIDSAISGSAASARAFVGADLVFVAVADGQQHLLGVVQVAALLAVVLEDVRLDDRIDRAGFFAEAAEDALGQVDVVARGAARAVVALLRIRS